MGEWQPIETAPRDGTLVLCWLNIGGHALVYRHRSAWRTGPIGEAVKPTHWQPLPAPPKEGEDG